MIAGPVLSPCSFHSSWSCAALRQGHPASRDQLTDQEQCEAAKRITTRAKILSIGGPKTQRQKCSGFQGRQSGPPQFKNMCGHKHSQGVENNCSRRCKTMGTQWHSGMRNFCRVPAETIETCPLFFDRRQKFCRQTAPVLGPETDPKTGAKSSGHKQIKLRLNEWPPFWGPFLGSQNGGRFVGKILVTGRKIARVSIVSARTRQKFSMPLLFHGFAAPQALVLHTLRTFMATHVLELFKNMCGHKHSQGVENNCSRRCKTMGTQWHSGMRNFCRVPAETIETCPLFFDRRQKFCRQTAPVLGSRNGPQNGGQVVRTQANQIETE